METGTEWGDTLWDEQEKVRIAEAMNRAEAKVTDGFFLKKAEETGLSRGKVAQINYVAKEKRLLFDVLTSALDLKENAKVLCANAYEKVTLQL